MLSLSNYIFESREISTTSNKQRRKELEKWLKNKNYEDYVTTLNKMIDDPKAKTLLEDGFGGELGDTKLTFNVKEIPVSQLILASLLLKRLFWCNVYLNCLQFPLVLR